MRVITVHLPEFRAQSIISKIELDTKILILHFANQCTSNDNILFQKTARKSADLATETATMAGRRVDARRPRSTTAAAAAAERTVGGLRVLFSGIPAAGMSS